MAIVYITTYYKNNYGSALQAYALQKALEGLNQKSFVIRYINNDEGRSKLYLALRFIKRFVYQFKPEKHYGLARKIKLYREMKSNHIKYDKINAFCNKHFDFVDYDIKRDVIHFDANNTRLIAGSDQLWNIMDHTISPLYLFSFVDDSIPKYSYAVSLGMNTLTDSDIKYYEDNLKHFNVISLREKTSCEQLKHSSLSPKLRNDIDPTLLLTKKHWTGIASDCLIDNKYIFIYMIRPDDRLFDYAYTLNKDLNYEIVYCGLLSFKKEGIRTLKDVGVEDFLSLINNAEYVITNSFHGTCFSVIFHKQFVTFPIESTGLRSLDFLRSLNLEDRLIQTDGQLISMNQIDYSCVDGLINEKRRESFNYLKEIIS